VSDLVGNDRKRANKAGYIGADSSLRFNHAAHAARMSKPAAFVSNEMDPTVMSPLTGTLLPTSPDSLESMMAMEDIRGVYLPSLDLCMKYSARFFDEIHCTYWFYSPEQYYILLDKTIEDRGAGCSPSWLCCLYSIFAICSAQPCSLGQSLDAKSSTDYLSMARSLVPRVYDEADVESVKALAILVSAVYLTLTCLTVCRA
jgi:DNA-binding XRE family transcriptional regulator